ncbi:uncharacterized protein L3040_005921 [Drepanopeziza brunnea f. sp. 'multigermtubi']|uniref:uncharacterized protein n=1 Tax=Drepanopeziza brunnea f. sp. 'multigermtubi' TaxID=698441 RepID=UPI00239B832A|nr:hypothetical protein L3040_005921 [Drepanopeziza brunnea f. sp. 'multigermtubi']
MPRPCSNCVRFHYGECNNTIKQCFECDGFGHIDRYCPNRKNNIYCFKGEPLAGTRRWCERHGLNDDPELKRRILNALKTNPGSVIFVNDRCIYRGCEKHFEAGEFMTRGRQLKERMRRDRARTRSSQSPDGRFGHQNYRPRNHDLLDPPPSRQEQLYRSRSPLCHNRRTPSPYRLPDHPPGRERDFGPRSPRNIPFSNAVPYNGRGRETNNENRAPPCRGLPAIKFSMPPARPDLRRQPPLAFEASAARPDDNDVSGVLQARDINARPQPQTNKESQSQIHSQAEGFRAYKESHSRPQLTPSLSPQSADDVRVADPHFVLGVTRGAGKDEITGAYK